MITQAASLTRLPRSHEISITKDVEAVQRFDPENAIDQFLASQDIKDSSKETYKRALRQFFTWIKDNGISSMNRDIILRYKAELKSRKLSPLSISIYIVAVRRFFEWAESMRYCPNIARGIKVTKKTQGFRKDSLTIDQIRNLFDSIEKISPIGKRDYALLNLLIRTGLRTIEVIRADIEDMRQQGGEALLWIQGKGRDDKDQFVILTPETLRPIYDYLKSRKARKTGPLFMSASDRNYGKRLTTRTIRQIVKDRLRAIGIVSDRLTAHSLRHTCITLSLQAGATIQEAQALARHSSINTTLIYAHNIERLKNAPERKIDQLLAESINL
jgi:integrase/recombinase XerD